MKNITTLMTAVALVWGVAAEAHGPTRQKITESIEINAAPDAVWNIIKDFGSAHAWMPMVASTTSQGGNEKGATRELTLKKGGVIKEELKSYEVDAKKFSYRISDEPDCAVLPVKNYSATISVEAAGSGSKVEWNGAYYRCFLNNNPPPDQNEEAANKAIGEVYKESLANLKALAEKK